MRKRRPSHNYSEDAKRMCLQQVQVGDERNGENRGSVYRFCERRGTPSPSTIYRWKRELAPLPQDPATIPPQGRPPKLSLMERKVVGGWVLDRASKHEKTDAHSVCSFIADAFREDVSKSWVSHNLSSLALTSYQAANCPQKYNKPNIISTLHRFLLDFYASIDGELEDAKVVAVNNVRFAHSQAVLRTYGPEGG